MASEAANQKVEKTGQVGRRVVVVFFFQEKKLKITHVHAQSLGRVGTEGVSTQLNGWIYRGGLVVVFRILGKVYHEVFDLGRSILGIVGLG